MKVVRPWLALFDWEIVTAQNMVLCEAKSALHKPTSDDMTRPKLCGIRSTPQR